MNSYLRHIKKILYSITVNHSHPIDYQHSNGAANAIPYYRR